MKFEIEIDEEKVRGLLTEGYHVEDLPRQVAYAVQQKAKEILANQIVNENTYSTIGKDDLASDIKKIVLEKLTPAIESIVEDRMTKRWGTHQLEEELARIIDTKIHNIIEEKSAKILSRLMVVIEPDPQQVAEE